MNRERGEDVTSLSMREEKEERKVEKERERVRYQQNDIKEKTKK